VEDMNQKGFEKIKKIALWTIVLALSAKLDFLANILKIEHAQAAAPVQHLVISEIQTSGSTLNDEFIELYNPTDAPINLSTSSLRLHIRNKNGTDANKSLIFINQVIPAFGFFLIGGQDYDGVFPDAAYTSSDGISLEDDGGVYISNSDLPGQGVIDKLGWGAQPEGGYEGVAFEVNPGSHQSLERKPGFLGANRGNAVDTDNNRQDFLLRDFSEPQDSLSPIENPDTPAPVTNFNVSDKPGDDGSALILRWEKSLDDARLDNLAAYRVYRKEEGGSYSMIKELPKGTQEWVDETVIKNKIYYYQVESFDGFYSSFSLEFGPISPIDNRPLEITNWSPTGYVNTNQPVVSAKVIENSYPVDPDSILFEIDGQMCSFVYQDTNHIIYCSPGVNLAEGLHRAFLRVAETDGRTAEKDWYFGVDTVAPSANALPLPPAVNTHSFNINYTAFDATSGVDYVEVWYSYSLDGQSWTDWFQYDGQFVSSPIVFETNRAKGDGYYEIFLEATDKAGNKEEQPCQFLGTVNEDYLSEATILVDTVPPETPKGLTATLEDSYVKISWKKIADAHHYEIWRASSDFSLIAVVPGTQNFYTDKKVSKGKKYQYKIVAVDLAGNRAESEVISISTSVLSRLVPTEVYAAPSTESEKTEEKVTPPSASEVQPPNTQPEKILGGEEQKEPRNWAPIIVISSLIILVIAAYLGWRWYSKKTTTQRW